MKLLISGSSSLAMDEIIAVLEEFRKLHEISCVLVGNDYLTDSVAKQWANNKGILYFCLRTDWENRGRGAWITRNENLIQNADAVLAIYKELALDTRHAISLALEANIPVYAPKFDATGIHFVQGCACLQAVTTTDDKTGHLFP